MRNFGVIWEDNKKVLNDLVIYCKTQGGQNDQNDWWFGLAFGLMAYQPFRTIEKRNKILKYYRKYSHELPQGRKCCCYGLASSKPRS